MSESCPPQSAAPPSSPDQRPRRWYLLAASAVAGGSVLALEVLAARTMAPAIGSGSVAWSALLAVALGSLACGNLLGGLLADRLAAPAIVAWSLAPAGAALAIFSQLYPAAMRWSARAEVISGSILAAVLTQFLPMLLVGVVSPAILAAGRGPGRGGRWAGAVLAAGSAGGIVGALVVGLLALPGLGIARCYLLLAFALALVSTPLAWAQRRWLAASVALAAMAAAAALWVSRPADGRIVQSRYGQIELRREPAGATLLIDGLPQTGLIEPVRQWAGLRQGYLLEMALGWAENPREALVIGLGGGLAPRLLEAHGLSCQCVEIDPAVVETARQELGFDGRAAVADGRAYLARTERQWDLLVVDVCTADRLPAHLFTVEALRLMRRRLAPGGVLAMQFIGDEGAWSASVMETTRAAFGDCLAFRPAGQIGPVGPRWIFAGAGVPPSTALARQDDATPWRPFRPSQRGTVLTDDRFPVELHWARTALLWRRLYAQVP